MRPCPRLVLSLLALVGPALLAGCHRHPGPNTDWQSYNGQPGGDHYSLLHQINRSNVQQLRQAWSFDTGETGGLQTNPLVIGGTLYAYTPSQQLVALDAASGKQLWRFSAGVPASQPNRGLCYWTDGHSARLLAGVMDHLYALNPRNGKSITSFGDHGSIDLRQGLDEADPSKTFAVLTTPGVLFKDLIILGFRAPETQPAPHGDIRAYDVHTGKLRWSFHTIPHPGEPGYETWPAEAWRSTGAANNWAGMSLDAERGIVYVPTGSAVNDFYGADRLGDDLYANTLLALDAATGKLLWHFQGVHHDVWDRDFPAPPALVTVQHQGHAVDAVAQTSKQGYVFLFDRVSGQPLFPIEERPFPASTVPGERTSPTQPIPVAPEPFARQRLTADLLTTRTPAAHAAVLAQFRTYRSDGQFVPLALNQQTVVFPGFDGGAEWGGPAVDPTTSVLYVNANDVPYTGGLVAYDPATNHGEALYRQQCGLCHGVDRRGSPPAFPSLVDVTKRLDEQALRGVIHNGRGRMNGFPSLSSSDTDALLRFLASDSLMLFPQAGARAAAPTGRQSGRKPDQQPGDTAYSFTGYRKFQDPDGYPAVQPPWGTLNAIDLNTGKYLWKVPLGEYPELAAHGMPNTGSENYGGPVVTAGGLVIIGATVYDRRLRIFDSATGQLLWQTTLPYAGVATPATYMVDGKQYIVIAASGQRNPKGPQGAAYVAFALP